MEKADHLYELTGVDFDQRASMSRYYGRLAEVERIEAMQLQADLIRQNRKRWKDIPQAKFYYAMLCLALWKMEWSRSTLSQKSGLPQEEAEAKAEELSDRRMDTFKATQKEGWKKKASPKAPAIDTRLYNLVTKLRDKKGYSWREVSEYLGKYHKTKISLSYLRDIYMRETKDREKRKEATGKIESQRP